MHDLKINVSDETIREMMSQSILKAIDATSRDALVASAIKHLVTPAKTEYGRLQNSPLLDAFERALEDTARRICRDYIDKNVELQTRLEELFREAAAKAFEGDARKRLVDAMANNLQRAMFGKEDR